MKLRSYFRNTIHLVRSKRYEVLLQKMSTRLRGDAAFRMCEFRLRTVSTQISSPRQPRDQVCDNSLLAVRACTVHESIHCGEGRCGKAWAGLSGALWQRCHPLNDNLRDLNAIALTFVHLFSADRHLRALTGLSKSVFYCEKGRVAYGFDTWHEEVGAAIEAAGRSVG